MNVIEFWKGVIATNGLGVAVVASIFTICVIGMTCFVTYMLVTGILQGIKNIKAKIYYNSLPKAPSPTYTGKATVLRTH